MLWTPKPYSQQSANGQYSKVNESCPQLPTYFFNIHYNIILPSVPGFSNRLLSFMFTEQNFESTSLLYMSHASPTYHEEYQIWSSSLCNSSILGPHIFFTTSFWNTFSLSIQKSYYHSIQAVTIWFLNRINRASRIGSTH